MASSAQCKQQPVCSPRTLTSQASCQRLCTCSGPASSSIMLPTGRCQNVPKLSRPRKLWHSSLHLQLCLGFDSCSKPSWRKRGQHISRWRPGGCHLQARCIVAEGLALLPPGRLSRLSRCNLNTRVQNHSVWPTKKAKFGIRRAQSCQL